MTKLIRKVGALPLVAVCLIALGGAAALAQRQFTMARAMRGRPEVKVLLSGSLERDNESLSIEKVESVRPGEVVNWVITSQNDGTAPAGDYVAVGQIPRGTAFVAGSATAEGAATVEYSIDGGKSFSQKPTIEEKQADGSVKRVPAPTSMYTQVRYEWADPLADGGKVVASYKVRVK